MTDARFELPLYTAPEAAHYLGVPTGTLRRWLRSSDGGRTLLHEVPHADGRRGPTVPFIGFAEGYVLASFRNAGVSVRRIRPALERLQDEFDISYALASKRLLTDGTEILYNYSSDIDDISDLVVVRNRQVVFTEVVQQYLRCLEWDADGLPRLVRLPQYRPAEVIVDPDREFGRPFFASARARVADVLDMFYAGEPIEVVADEFGISGDDVEAALRAHGKLAA